MADVVYEMGRKIKTTLAIHYKNLLIIYNGHNLDIPIRHSIRTSFPLAADHNDKINKTMLYWVLKNGQ